MTYYITGSSNPLQVSENNIGYGGEATVHLIDNSDMIAKIFHKKLDDTSVKRSIIEYECLEHSTELLAITAFPRQMITDKFGKVVGYTMDNFADWQNFSNISNYDLKVRVWAFCCLHRSLEVVHKHGYIVTDFNPDNVMFKLTANNFYIRFIDVDSWSCPSKDLYSNIIKPSQAQHPELYQAIREKKPLPAIQSKHDWWSFTFLLYRYLTELDPFTGCQYDKNDKIISYKDRVTNKIVIQHPDVKRSLQLSQKLYRIGVKPLHACNRILTTKVNGPYPRWLLANLFANIKECRSCKEIINHELRFCPFCNNII